MRHFPAGGHGTNTLALHTVAHGIADLPREALRHGRPRRDGWDIEGGGAALLERGFSLGGVDGDMNPASGGHTGREVGGRDSFAFGEVEGCNVELLLVE